MTGTDMENEGIITAEPDDVTDAPQTGGAGDGDTPASKGRHLLPWLGSGLKKLVPGVFAIAVIGVSYAAYQGNIFQWPGHLAKFMTAGRAALSEPALPGVLSIEPPQLYTRERLVNDRFRQANWLEQQLARTKNDELTIAVAREKRSQAFEALLSATGQPPSDDALTAGEGDSVATSTLQRLTAVGKIRQQLRTDLMDTLLDDGHDLEGNTLYRLNFDAVVMPLINRRTYPGTAVFIIEARDPYSTAGPGCLGQSDTHNCRALSPAKEQKRITDDVELLRGWQREIQQFLTKVLEARIEAFRQDGRLHNPVDPKENIALDWFLRRELISAFMGAIVYDPEVVALCRDQGLVRANMTRSEQLSPGWASACKDWISETIGFAWSEDNPVPTVSPSHALAPMIQSGFRKAIRRAHYVNTVLALEGQMTLQRLQQPSDPQQPDQPENQTGGAVWQAQSALSCPQGPYAGPGFACDAQGRPENQTVAAPEQPMSVGAMPQDEDYKRALVRLISVWQAMGQWGRDTQFSAMMQAAYSGPEQVENSNPVSDPSGVPADFRLLKAMAKFETHLPAEGDIQDLRDRLRNDGARNFVLVRGQAMSHPQLRSSIEHCGAPQGGQAPAMITDVYKCLMMRSEGAYASSELMSRFLLARLQEELDVYDRESRSIRDFLDISLEGCSTTGCRIQVSQHRDLPGNEVFGAREAGYLPATHKLGKRASGDAVPARFYDFIGAFKTQDRGFWTQTNWHSYLNANCLAKNLSLRSIRLTDEGLRVATQIVDHTLASSAGTDACPKRQLSYETRHRLERTKSCLGLARRHADNHAARTEIYLSCMLRNWINTQRSDVTVYAVSPRAGEGDDLTHRFEEASARVAAGLPSGAPVGGQMSLADSRSTEQIISNPRVIGFSHLPGSNSQDPSNGRAFTDRATFGWAIRPRRLSATGGYQSSHHRLSAVVSLPSWWKRVDFDVRACWVQPPQVSQPEVDFTTLCDDARPARAEAMEPDEDIMPSMRQFRRHFEIQLPRRVEEITSRFNFDFIRSPYYYREFDQYVRRYPQILSLEAGRPGKLVLQGERLWRGTVVTVNNHSADSIVVLPDMKGVVAHFSCVYPPDGMFHFKAYGDNLEEARLMRAAGATGSQASGGAPPPGAAGTVPSAPLFVWTSEGGTTDKEVTIHPFVQRWENEKPCWLKDDGQ